MITYRTLLIAAILLICFGAALWCLLEYDLHKFQESLKSESQISDNERPKGTSGQKQSEVPDSSVKSEKPISGEDLPSAAEDLSSNETRLSDEVADSEQGEKAGDLSENSQEFDWAVEEMSTETLKEVWQDPNTSAINYNELSPEEFEVHYRAQLREEHGDLPEIDVYAALYRRFIHERKPITLDEHIRFIELTAFFYPSADNELGVQELKDLRSKVGGNVIFFPAEDLSIEE